MLAVGVLRYRRMARKTDSSAAQEFVDSGPNYLGPSSETRPCVPAGLGGHAAVLEPPPESLPDAETNEARGVQPVACVPRSIIIIAGQRIRTHDPGVMSGPPGGNLAQVLVS
jgi:hypothetical protein